MVSFHHPVWFLVFLVYCLTWSLKCWDSYKGCPGSEGWQCLIPARGMCVSEGSTRTPVFLINHMNASLTREKKVIVQDEMEIKKILNNCSPLHCVCADWFLLQPFISVSSVAFYVSASGTQCSFVPGQFLFCSTLKLGSSGSKVCAVTLAHARWAVSRELSVCEQAQWLIRQK